MSDEPTGNEPDAETHEIEEDLDSLEEQGKEMEADLEGAEEDAGDVEVPDPADSEQPGIDEADVPEGEGESAEKAGQ